MREVITALLAFMALIGTATAQTWELVKSDALGVEIEFPGKAEFTEANGDDGGKFWTYAVKSQAAAYDLTIWDLPKADVAAVGVPQILDNVRAGTLASLSAKLRTETKIEMNGYEARDVTADVMGMVWRGRSVIAENRLYQLVAIVSKSAEKSPDTERYFASFKLLPLGAHNSKAAK